MIYFCYILMLQLVSAKVIIPAEKKMSFFKVEISRSFETLDRSDKNKKVLCNDNSKTDVL